MNLLDDLKTIPKSVLNIWYQIFVRQYHLLVEQLNHNNPKVIPKKIDIYIEGEKNIKIAMTTALKEYKILNNIFLLYFDPRYPIPRVPIILNKPIKAKIIVAAQPPRPLSCI